MGNMTIIAPKHPSGRPEYSISVPTLHTGISIFNPHNDSDGVARHFRWPYYRIVSSSSFDFVATFRSYEARLDFAEWVRTYLRLVADDVATTFLSPMEFRLPARNFVKQGIPLSLQYGDDVRKVTYPMSISVKGGSSPVEAADLAISTQISPDGDYWEETYVRYPATLKAVDRINSEDGDIFRTSDVLTAEQLAHIVGEEQKDDLPYTGDSPNSGRLA